MKRLLLSMVLLAGLLAGAANAENWCQRFPDNAVLFGYVNVKGVRAIPAIDALLDGQDRLSKMADSARQYLAVDLETVTDVWFAVSPAGGPISVLQGTYNLTTIRGVAGAAQNLRVSTPPGTEFAVTDVNPNNAKGMMVAFLSPRELALGQPAQVEAFLANVAAGRQHARAKELSGFAKPTHLVECVMLGVPPEMRQFPPAIASQVALLTLSIDGADAADFELTLQPRNPDMAAPLTTWCQSTFELLRLLPPEQLANLSSTQTALLKTAKAAPAPGGVALSASLPVALVAEPLGRKLGTGGPAPQPKAQPQAQPQPKP